MRGNLFDTTDDLFFCKSVSTWMIKDNKPLAFTFELVYVNIAQTRRNSTLNPVKNK